MNTYYQQSSIKSAGMPARFQWTACTHTTCSVRAFLQRRRRRNIVPQAAASDNSSFISCLLFARSPSPTRDIHWNHKDCCFSCPQWYAACSAYALQRGDDDVILSNGSCCCHLVGQVCCISETSDT